MGLEFKDFFIGFISPLIAAAFVSFAAFRKFKHENRWAEKLAIYKSIIECIKELQMFSGEIYRINIGGPRFTNLSKAELEIKFYQNIQNLYSLTETAELLIDYEVVVKLDELRRELAFAKMHLEKSENKEDQWSLIGFKSEEMIQACNQAMSEVIKIGKLELK